MKNFKIKFILIFICLFALFIPKVNAQVEDVSNPDEGYTHTFVFYNGGEVWETSILKNDEVLTQPANPSRENQVFVGWYKDSSFTEVFDGFNKTATLDDGTTNLYAKFQNVYYVTYYDQNNNIISTDRVDEGSNYTIKTESPLFVLDNPRQKTDGWKDDSGTEYIGTNNITVNEDINLRPIISDGLFVRFHSDGGSPVASQFIPINEKATRPSDPVKKGYSFAGWYTDTSYNQEFNFNSSLTDNIDLFAKWEPAETEYILVFYVQNANDDDYTFYSSRQTTGITGENVELKQTDRNYINNAVKIENIANYFINENKLLQEIASVRTIESDGSTVLNIYLDRVYWNLKFPNIDQKYKIRWGQNYDFLFGQPGFPDAPVEKAQIFTYNGSMVEYLHYDSQQAHNFYSPQQMKNRYLGREVPNGATLLLTPHIESVGGPNRSIAYLHYETIESTPDNKQYRDGQWLFRQLSQNRTLRPEDTTKWKIVRTFNQSNVTGAGYLGIGYDEEGQYRWAEIWYDRQLYDLTIIGINTTTVEDIMWGKNIKSYLPELNTKVKDGITYRFVGWSIDEAGLTTFDPETDVMPDSDLTLYAKWEPLKSKVTFDPNFGSDTGIFDNDMEVIVNTGKKVAEPVLPQRNSNSSDFSYVFLGWTINGQPYDFESPVTEDITLVAVWGIYPIPTHKVIYNPGAGSGIVTDNKKYLMNSTSKVLLGNRLTPPTDSYFVYWIDEDNEIYYSNDLVNVIDKDVKLTAVYRKRERTSLIYNLNYSTFGITNSGVNELDKDSAKNLLINSIIILRDLTGDEIPKGYTFGGWYLDKECTGESVTRVIIDNNNPLPNMIYAKWIKDEEDGKGSTDGSKEVIETVPRTVLNPNTGDNISLYIMLFILSIIGMSSTVLIKK